MSLAQPWPRPDWSPLPHAGCEGVEGRVMLRGGVNVAELRFAPHATIHEHAADHHSEVICLEGSGFTSVGGAAAPIRAGQRVSWPAGAPHRLWTEGEAMRTLMVEVTAQAGGSSSG